MPTRDLSDSTKRTGGLTAATAILLTIALGGSVLALLIYRSVITPTPNRVFVVYANSDWNGAELIVDGGTLPQPAATTVMPAGNYIVPFFLEPGKYTLHVKSEGIEVVTREFDLAVNNSDQIDLTRTGATTRPVSAPATNASNVPPSAIGE